MKFRKPSLSVLFGGRRSAAAGCAECACNSGDEGYSPYDKGNRPYVENILKTSYTNDNFRTALWTGEHLQLTVMTVERGEDIGEEMHEELDQLFFIMSGAAEISVGDKREEIKPLAYAEGGYVMIVPAGTWHNVKSIGRSPLKLFSVYAPKAHPFGTVDKTKPVE